MTAATAAALPVASTTTTSSCRSPCAKAVSRSRRMSTRPSRLSLPSSQATASAKARWMSSPIMRMPPPFRAWLVKRELAGDTTPTDPRSRRIRASRRGRPCNELGLSAQRLLAACPHLRAPGAPRPRWAHHNAVLQGEQPDAKGTADLIPDNGMVERFNGRVQREVLGITIHSHRDLEILLHGFNRAYKARRQRVLGGLSPDEVVRRRLEAEPRLASRR